MKAKHITFISSEKEWFKNDELLKSGRLIKKWNKNVYDHIQESETPEVSNLVIEFGKYETCRFYTKNEIRYFKMPDYTAYDLFTKIEQNKEFKVIKQKLEKYFQKYALTRVTSRNLYYRNLNFEKVKKVNNTKSGVFTEKIIVQ